jgi:hypothetical protein
MHTVITILFYSTDVLVSQVNTDRIMVMVIGELAVTELVPTVSYRLKVIFRINGNFTSEGRK